MMINSISLTTSSGAAALLAALVMGGAAHAEIPVFSAKCPQNNTIDTDRTGTVRVNGAVASVRKFNDSDASMAADRKVPQTGIRNRYTAIFVNSLYLTSRYHKEKAAAETMLRYPSITDAGQLRGNVFGGAIPTATASRRIDPMVNW